MSQIKDEIEKYRQEFYRLQEKERYLKKLNKIRERRGEKPITLEESEEEYNKFVWKPRCIDNSKNILNCSFYNNEFDIYSSYRENGSFYEKIAVEKITELNDNEIFVFGSKLGGFSKDGAAIFAYENFKADPKIDKGLSGQIYALPILDENGNKLSFEDIKKNFIEFFICCKEHLNLEFLLIKVGTGVGCFQYRIIADIFHDAMYEYVNNYKQKITTNIAMPIEFVR